MRVLALNWRDLRHPAAGGAEVYLQHVLSRWAAQGHTVTLVTASSDGLPAQESVDGYRIVRVGGRLSVYKEARDWWRANGRGQFDVVIDAVNTVPFMAHSWVDDGARTIALVHQTCEEIWHHNAPRGADVLGRYILEPAWLRTLSSTPIMAVSDSTAASLRRFGAERITVVPEGFEPPDFEVDLTKEALPTIVFMGRMVPYKRPTDVIEAFTRARVALPGLQAWLMGGGPDLEKVRAAAPPGVEVLGRVSEEEKFRRFAAAHIHVATSVREGWGLVVTEAASVGTPTIAYDTPGLRDSTRAAGGVVIPPHPEALAEWIVDLMPKFQANPPQPLPYGGAVSWDDVAAAVLESIEQNATVPSVQERRSNPWSPLRGRALKTTGGSV